MEVLQLVRADRAFGLLLAGNQLRADVGLEHAAQRPLHVLAELLRLGDPRDQVLDQRLRHARVHVVVRHVVADAVGRPAERELGEIARADDEAALLIGKAKKVAGALAGLHVLEGDVIDLFPLGEGMADVFQHLQARRTDVDFLGGGADRTHQLPGLVLGARARGEARHRVRHDVAAGQAELVHRARADDERLRRVEPARHADDELLRAGGAHARREALHLDAVHLFAAVAAVRRVARHVGKLFHAPGERELAARQR